MAIDPTTGLEEEEDQYYPGALPAPNRDQLGALRDKSFKSNVDLLHEDPFFADLDFDGGGGQAEGGWDEEVVVEAEPETSGWDEELTITDPKPDDEKGFFNNTARVMGQRGLELVGSIVRGAGEVGEDLQEVTETGRFVWDDGLLPSWYSYEEFEALKKQGVTENLLTETIPMAFQDRDLGGEKRHTPEEIKAAWAAGDVAGVGSAVAKYIGETGIESIPDMLTVVYSMPLYALGRSQEVAEERVRNERLSEALAANPDLDEQAQGQISSGYVQTEDIDTGDLLKAAPFATLSALLERIGAKGIAHAGKETVELAAKEVAEAGYRAVAKEGLHAARTEAATEFFQEGVIEYIGERVGTSQEGTFANLSAGEGIERGLWAALAGGGAGGVAGTTIAGVRELARPSTGEDVDPETGQPTDTTPPPDAGGPQQSFEDTSDDGMSQAEKEALLGQLDTLDEQEGPAAVPEQGGLDLPNPPAPTPETATTSPSPTSGPAPSAAGPEPIAAPAPVAPAVAAAPVVEPVEAAAPVENPMIQRKDVEAGFRELNKKTKEGAPGIRKAIQGLGVAIAAVFPGAKSLPGLKGTVGPKRMGEYFAALDEEIRIDETLPNLKGFLQEIFASPDAASAVQNINRLKDYVANSGVGVVESTAGQPIAEQGASGVTAYDTYEAERLSKKQEYNYKNKKTGKTERRTRISGTKNRLANRAVAVDELATTVKALATKAAKLGLDVPAEVNELIRRAKSYRESSSVAKPVVQKGGAGAVSTPQKFRGKNLDEVGSKLREAAQTLTKQLATVDGSLVEVSSTTTKKTDTKAKVEKTSPVTEAPVAPKKAEAAKKTSKAKSEKKTKKAKEAKATSKGKQSPALAAYGELRRRAKELGLKSTGKKAELTARVAEAEQQRGESKTETKVVTKKEAVTEKAKKPDVKGANPDKVLDVEPAVVARGRQAGALVEALGFPAGTPLDVALKESGISKKAVGTLKAILASVSPTAQAKIMGAIREYKGPEDIARTVALIEEAVGGGVSPQNMMDVLGFLEGKTRNNADTTLADDVEEQLERERMAEEQGFDDAEEMEEITGEMGFGDVYEEDYNSEEIKEFNDRVHKEPSPKDRAELDGLAIHINSIIEFLTEPGQVINDTIVGFGLKDVNTLTTNEFLTILADNLPNNSKYQVLAKRLMELELDVPIAFFIDAHQLKGSSPSTSGKYFWSAGHEQRLIGIVPSESLTDTILATLHEIIHAATVLKYHADEKYKAYTDELYLQAVKHLPDNFTDPEMKANAESMVADAIDAGVTSKEAFDLIQTFLTDAHNFGDPNTMKIQPKFFYGLLTPTEFLAESFTNPQFQAYLGSYRVNATAEITRLRPKGGPLRATSLIHAFMAGVSRFVLRFSPRNNILREVMFLASNNFLTEQEIQNYFTNSTVAQRRAITKSAQTLTNPQSEALENFEGKYDDASLTKLTNIALKLKRRAKNILKKAAADTRTDNKSASGIGAATRQARQAIDLLNIALEAVEGGKKYVVQDHVERAESYLSTERVSSIQSEALESFEDIVDNVKKGAANDASSLAKEAKSAGKNVNLGFSGRDAIERENRSIFDRAAEKLGIKNPLTAYAEAKNYAQTLVRSYERKAHTILKSFSKMPNHVRSISEVMMKDITMANIDPTQPLNSVANKHIWTQPNQNPKPKQKKDGTWYTPKARKPQIRKKFKDRAIKARDNWLAFSKKYPVAAKVLQRMAALTKLIHDTKVTYALTALGEAFEFDAATIKALGSAKTAAAIDKIIDPNEVEQITAQLDNKEDMVGMTKEETKELKKKLAISEARAQAASSAKTILHESSIKGWYFPLRRYGQYVVSTGPDVTGNDRYVAFHETQKLAEADMERHNATASEDNQVSLSLKLEASTQSGSVGNVMSDLKRRIKDGPTKARLDGAMAELLAANASYESQLKRENVDGVATKDMARAFEEYVHVSKYTLGDIRMAHTISTAISGINRVAADRGGETGLDADAVIQAGRVQNELAKRNKADGQDRKKSGFQKTVGMLGFLNFLGAPSYWALNATQTYVVTIPYFSAKYGEAKGPVALFKAQKVIFGAVKAAMKSGDKSYEGFKKHLPPSAQRLVEAMEADNLIQSTIAHEFGDMTSPTTFNKMRESAYLAPVAKVAEFALNVMEKVPEGIEHYNRISTGLAAYQLSNGDFTAVKDAVNETQMNYDTNNRARLLKSLPEKLGGGGQFLITPVMMFKTFGVGMAKLFYGAAFDVAYKKGGRVEALKLAGYLMASHTLFAGVAGGLMVAPVAIIIAALNSVLDPDDEWNMEDAAYAMGQDLQGDFLATMMERGLPAAALGVDMSRSINLSNLIWMGNDQLDYREFGDLQEGMFQVFGPVAQYAAGTVREGLRLVTGDPRGGVMEFVKTAFPVKVGSGILEGVEYSTEGMRTGSDLELIPADEFGGFFRTAMGFQTTQKAETKDAYYTDTRLDMRRSSRKSDLITFANRAIVDNDWQKLESIIEDMTKYNLSVPQPKYRVNAGDMAALRSRRRTAQREYDKKYRYSD